MEVLIDGKWQNGQPKHGDVCREIVGGGGVIKTIFNDFKFNLLDISISNVTNVLADFNDTDMQFTLNEGVESIATGELLIPDQNFRVPFVRTDTNRKAYMPASVVDGVFTLSLNFKTSGEWIVNTDLLNSELARPTFSIAEHRFKVI